MRRHAARGRSRALRRRYGHAEGTDRSTNSTVVEYAVQELFKGKSPSAAAKHTAKKLSGFENMFLGPGVTTIDVKALEAALWDRMAEYAAKGVRHFKAGKEHYTLGSTLQFFHQKPALRTKLKELVIAKLSADPFTADDGT